MFNIKSSGPSILDLIAEVAQKLSTADRPTDTLMIDWAELIEGGQRPRSAALKFQRNLGKGAGIGFGRYTDWITAARRAGASWARFEVTSDSRYRGYLHLGVEVPDTTPSEFSTALRNAGLILREARVRRERDELDKREAEKRVQEREIAARHAKQQEANAAAVAAADIVNAAANAKWYTMVTERANNAAAALRAAGVDKAVADGAAVVVGYRRFTWGGSPYAFSGEGWQDEAKPGNRFSNIVKAESWTR